jgi:hypothetical protein
MASQIYGVLYTNFSQKIDINYQIQHYLMAARKHYTHPVSVKLLFAVFILYLTVSAVFFTSLLSDQLSPIKFGTFTIMFSFLIVAYLFAMFFGLWKMRKWGLYFILFVAGIVVFDMVTSVVFSELHFSTSLFFNLVYQIISVMLIVLTFYVTYYHKDGFE